MNKKTKKIIPVVLYFALWILLAIVCLKEDLAISINLHNPNSMFGKIFQVIGELPNSITLVLSSATLFSLRQPNGNIRIFSLYTLGYGFICFVTTCFCIMYAWKQAFGHKPSIIITAMVSLLITLMILYFFTRIPQYKLERFKEIAVIGVAVGGFALVFSGAAKLLIGRKRPRDMKDPVREFVPWNKVTFLGDEGNSFPSGHTANATSASMLRLFVSDKNSKIKNIMLVILSYAWPIIVAFSRIVAGAHFASDTLFSFFICTGAFYIIRKIVENTNISNYL